MNKEKILNEIIEISILMSSQDSLNQLLSTIMHKAREITNADAGSLYLKEENHLRFLVAQNDTLKLKEGDFSSFLMKIDKNSIAGYCAYTGEVINIEDVYQIPENYPFSYNTEYDKKNNYKCTSMLVIPMKDRDHEIIGVLQLINAKDNNGNIVKFADNLEPIVESFASMAAVTIKNVQLKESLKSAYLETIYRLSVAAELKDTDTGLHIKRMSKYSEIIAKHLNLSKELCELILYASPLHDIGKIGIPDNVLLKPGKLNDEEWVIMRNHTKMGYDILKDSEHTLMKFAASVALNHHERFDGKGYPNKLAGENIPIEGRIVALADVFDALSSKRPYKDPWPLDKILKVINEEKNKQFDENIVNAFNNGLEEILEIQKKFED